MILYLGILVTVMIFFYMSNINLCSHMYMPYFISLDFTIIVSLCTAICVGLLVWTYSFNIMYFALSKNKIEKENHED